MRDKRLDALGVPDAARAHVTAWLDLLLEWNARIDLTAARDEDELCDLMLADAIVLAAKIDAGARVVDVGSGAGAPGLAIALLRPDLDVTLVEPLGKRVAFLRTVLGTVGRRDIALVRGRGESTRGEWDVAVSRATLAPAAWIPMGLRLAPRAWALLAREDAPEVNGAERVSEIAYRWPLGGAERRAVLYARAAP